MRFSDSSESRPITRQGIQALYTFTPFKLLRAEAEGYYSLILAPIAYFNISPSPRWRSEAVKSRLKVFLKHKKFSKTIVQPYQLLPYKFKKDSKDRYIYEHERIKEREGWRYPPTYIEFSWNALNSGYYCRLGWVLLSSQPRCPQESNCPNLKGNPCPYYSKKPLPYPSLFNVYPRIQRKFEDPTDNFQPVLAIRYEDRPLAALRFTDHGSFVAFIDGIVFSPKSAQIPIQPTVFLREGLGFEIGNVHAIELEFIPETLYNFIESILSSNIDVARWIILKYRLYMSNSEEKDFIPEKRGIKAFKELDKITRQAVQGIKQDKAATKIIREVREANISPDLISFASVLFLHSLAHILKNALAAKYGCKTEDINYYIEHPMIRTIGGTSEKIRIVLFEPAVGGFGYLKNFVESLRTSKVDLLEELINTAALRFCEKKSNESLKNLKEKFKQFQARYEELTGLILRAYHSSFPDTGVYPHVNSIRKAVAETKAAIEFASGFSEEERSVLDDLLAIGPHCWDGCQLCVMLERECSFLPFDQPFLVSERLSRAALERISDMLKHPISSYPLKKGVRKEFESLLSMARDEIDLVSPWISPEIIESLLKLCHERHLKIRIITTPDFTNKVQAQSLEKLIEAVKRFSPSFQARAMEELHAKGMLVDNIILLHGSFNFTTSGLDANIENVILDFSSEGTKKFQKEFDELWEKARPLFND